MVDLLGDPNCTDSQAVMFDDLILLNSPFSFEVFILEGIVPSTELLNDDRFVDIPVELLQEGFVFLSGGTALQQAQ